MTFELHLDLPAAVAPEEHAEVSYDDELDDARSVLRDLCASLAEVPGVGFTAAVGESMPVSVRRDLVVVMEQLRDLLVALRDEPATATLDLYEQGVEAQLLFAAKDGRMTIERRDLLGRPTLRREVSLPREEALGSLRTLARTFVDAARRRSPQRASHPLFTEWAQGLLAAAAL